MTILALLMVGCAHEELLVVHKSNFRSPRIKRELNYYVANFSSHETNHFYVGATRLDHGQLVEALVYWKEEQTLLRYDELEPDAQHDNWAWRPMDELKL